MSALNRQKVSKLVKRKPHIRYLVLSDIHLGHPRTRTKEIIGSLVAFFNDFSLDSEWKYLDVIFIAGDLFDGSIDFDSLEMLEFLFFFNRLMDFCEKLNIKLRVLEGTPSHDVKQPANLVPMTSGYKNLDFRYVETMEVEVFEDLGITCLYVNDEYAGSAKKAQEQIASYLNEIGLKKVDIAIMHGMFRYQVPELASDRLKYDEDFFLSIVKSYINIGHVHKFSKFSRIIAQGSFERLCHGEEEEKGAVLIVLDEEHGDQFYFLENKLSKIYKTLQVRYKDLDKALLSLTKTAKSLPDGSYLRVKTHRGHPILNVLDQTQREYPFIHFSKLVEEDEEERRQLIKQEDLTRLDYTPIDINRGNIVNMLLDEVKLNHTIDPHIQLQLEKKLEEIL